MVKITRDILDDIIEGKEVTHYVSPPKKKKPNKLKREKSNFNERMKRMGGKSTYRQSKSKKSSYVNPNLNKQKNNSSKQKLNDIQEKLKQMQGK